MKMVLLYYMELHSFNLPFSIAAGLSLKTLAKFFLPDKKRRNQVLSDERVRRHLTAALTPLK